MRRKKKYIQLKANRKADPVTEQKESYIHLIEIACIAVLVIERVFQTTLRRPLHVKRLAI